MGESFPEQPGDLTVFEDARRLGEEYRKAVKKFWVMEDQAIQAVRDGQVPLDRQVLDDLESAFQEAKRLQREHIRIIRGFRQRWIEWLDSKHPYTHRTKIVLEWGRCRAVVSDGIGRERQCLRRSQWRIGDIGDLEVCTQHANLIGDGELLSGLWSYDGIAYADDFVLEPFPGPFLWESTVLDRSTLYENDSKHPRLPGSPAR